MTDLISDQLGVIELASWADAWLHEPRGYHGKWIKAGEGTDRYAMPDHSRLVLAKGHGYKDPADHPFFKAHPVSAANIIKSWDAASPQEKAQGARWYADAHTLAANMSHGDAREGAILLASYSPQSSWPVNMFNATRAAEEHRALGPGDGMITGAMQANAQEGLDGKSVDEAMTSPKTRAFARLIETGGDTPTDGAGEVVIDRHALNVAAGETLPKAATDKAPIGDARMHEYVADQYRLAALQLSKREGTVIPPYVLQAVTWLHQQQISEGMDQATSMAGRGGAALKKGRVTGIANAWKRWASYAQAEGIPLTANTTLANMTLLGQILELANDSMIVQLAAWEHEARGPGGEWEHGGTGTIERVTHPIGDEGARGNSRPVSEDEFHRLAAEGKQRLHAIQHASWSTDGLHASWPQVRDRAWGEVRKSWGGATVDPRTGEDLPQGADKFAMSIKPTGLGTTSIPETASRAAFDQAMDAALAKYGNQLAKGGSYLGIFHDDDLHRIDIDPVTVLDSLQEVETIGAYTHAIGGAYRFSDGNGYWPPHVPGSAQLASDDHHFAGPGQWHSQAVAAQQPHDEPGQSPTLAGETQAAGDGGGTMAEQIELGGTCGHCGCGPEGQRRHRAANAGQIQQV